MVIKGYDGMNFEWDDAKNDKNIKNHGISFDMAAQVFYDPQRVELYDAKHSIKEDRYIVIGMVNKILYVVYTERKDCIRIISARLATTQEKEEYYGHKTHR